MTHERIMVDPEIMVSKPVINGTRITMELILRKIAAGFSTEQTIEAHPRLTPDDVYAAAAYTADVIH
ncbi:MAG: DUF433 domain-containing protein [bacterium]|nr:DUF433 domain-containing protein [bacterium]